METGQSPAEFTIPIGFNIPQEQPKQLYAQPKEYVATPPRFAPDGIGANYNLTKNLHIGGEVAIPTKNGSDGYSLKLSAGNSDKYEWIATGIGVDYSSKRFNNGTGTDGNTLSPHAYLSTNINLFAKTGLVADINAGATFGDLNPSPSKGNESLERFKYDANGTLYSQFSKNFALGLDGGIENNLLLREDGVISDKTQRGGISAFIGQDNPVRISAGIESHEISDNNRLQNENYANLNVGLSALFGQKGWIGAEAEIIPDDRLHSFTEDIKDLGSPSTLDITIGGGYKGLVGRLGFRFDDLDTPTRNFRPDEIRVGIRGHF